ncbi:MAG: hypothetical protein SFW65_05675 [Alphaproteobacteria bacterium]|nr:hypothetical protein [Alphaproteobacteria bacterium]
MTQERAPRVLTPDQQLARFRKIYPRFDPQLIAHIHSVTEFARPHGGKDFSTVMAWAMLESFGNPASRTTTGDFTRHTAFGAFHFKPETMLEGFLRTADLQVQFNPSLQGHVTQARALLALKAKNPAQFTAGALAFSQNMFKNPILTAQVQALIVASNSTDYVAHFLGPTGARNLREAAAGKNNITMDSLLAGLTQRFPRSELDQHLTSAANPFISPNMEKAAQSNPSYFFNCDKTHCRPRLPSETLREIERRVTEKTDLFEKDFPQLRTANLETPPEPAATAPARKPADAKKPPVVPTRIMAGQPR